MLLELGLIRHDVLIRTVEVFVQLVVEGLTRYLDADPKHNLGVDNVLLHGGFKNAHVALAVLFRKVVPLLLRRHDLVEMHLVVEILVELEALEWLDHLFNVLLQVFHQRLVLDFQHALLQSHVFLQHPLLLLLNDRQEDLALVILCFDLLGLEVYDLSEQIHGV